MDEIHDTIDSARDYRGALMADCLRRAWNALTSALTHGHDHPPPRNSLRPSASNIASSGHR